MSGRAKLGGTPGEPAQTAGTCPRVSFIVTSYNKAAYLPAVLASVWGEAQDVGGEVLLIDDGSTDGSEAICAAFAAAHPAVMYTRQNNMGIYRTLNRHAPRARGTWVRFCDSDDPLIPGSTRRLIDVAEHHGAAVAYGTAIRYGPEPLLPSQVNAARDDAVPASGCHPDGIMHLIRELTFTPSRSIYRRAGLAEALPVPEHLVSCQDFALLFPVLARGVLAWMDQPACYYLSGAPNQLSANDTLTRQQTIRITQHYAPLLARPHRRAAVLKAAQRTRRWLRKARPERNSLLTQIWLLGVVLRAKLGLFDLCEDLEAIGRFYEDELRDILCGRARPY